MRNGYKIVLIIFIGLLTISCASTIDLSENAELEKKNMSLQKAEMLLRDFIKTSSASKGLCMGGTIRGLTRVNYRKPIKVSNGKMNFHGYYAKLERTNVSGRVSAGSGRVSIAYISQSAVYTIDMRQIKKIRVIDTGARTPRPILFCEPENQKYSVLFKPKVKLPDQASLYISVPNQDDLDKLLAALAYLSPDAKLVGGWGL